MIFMTKKTAFEPNHIKHAHAYVQYISTYGLFSSRGKTTATSRCGFGTLTLEEDPVVNYYRGVTVSP